MGSEFKSIVGSNVNTLYWIRRLAGEPLDDKERAGGDAGNDELVADQEPNAADPFADGE